MGASEAEQTDSSPIKPVSSLRSHFENIAGSTFHSSDPAPGRAPTTYQALPSDRAHIINRPPSRTSIDLPNRTSSEDPTRTLRGDTSQKLVPPRPPTRRSLSPHTNSAPRPVSAGSVSATDPHRTSPSDGLQAFVPAVDGHPSASLPRSQPNIQGAESRHPELQPQTPSVLKSVKIDDSRQHGDAFRQIRPSEGTPQSTVGGGSERSVQKGDGGVRQTAGPPPVNRADKPKISSLPSAVQQRGDARAAPSFPRVTTLAQSELTVTTAPAPNGHLPIRRADVADATAQLSPFEPPPMHHYVAQKLRSLQDTTLQTESGGVVSDKQRTVQQPQPQPQPKQPYQATAAVKHRDAESGKHTERPNVARPSSPPRPPRPSQAPTSTTLIAPQHETHYSRPPRRSNTSGSVEEGEAASDTPAAFSIGDHRTSSDLTAYRDRRISTQGKPLAAKVRPAEATESRPYKPTSDHPDASRANRRKPFFRQGLREISNKHETRLVALCGEYVCSTGHVTKIWDIRDGNLVMTLLHQEPVRITSVAFRSSKNPKDMGRWLWLGTNHGEIQEIDVLNQEIAYVKSSAHPRREVITIHPRAEEMWTLDDEGKLHLWPSDATGSPSLRSSHYGFRVPKGHSFSLVAVNELWVATGKDIRVFRPSSDQGAHFDVLPRPLSQATAGDITSGAVLGPRSEEIYFGHTDGKVSIYARKGYCCLNIVNVSLYRISSLAGVGDHLWAGFNTGMLYVYDTRTDPWTVKKDWRGHQSPVIDLVVDRAHVPRLDPLRVASLGIKGFVRLWDGLLQEDWLESEMHSRHADYCTFRNISALVTTWNAGASVPHSLQRSGAEDTFFEELARHNDAPDFLVFGFQELVDLEDTKVTAKNLFRSSKRKETPSHEQISAQYRAWRDYLTRMVREYLPSESYYLLHTATMVGLFTCIFAKTSQSEPVRDVQSADVKCGMAGLYGNKGALVVRFAVDDSSLCFVNCHLAAGQSHTTHRNNDVALILETPELPSERDPARRIDLYVGGGDGTMILDHEICILNGDLNYRIDNMGRDTVINSIRANNLAKPLERDQLLLARRGSPGFRLRTFKEAPITFAPTYKYDVGTDTYDTSEKKRVPAWCDRLLYRGFDRIEQLHYRRHEVRVSDHRPVSGLFRIQVKKISPKQRLVAWERCQQALAAYKERLAREAR